MVKVRSHGGVVYRSAYRVMWCTKYRREVITDDVAERLGQVIREVCAGRDCNLCDLVVAPDHVRLLVGCDPQYGIHRLVKEMKASSSRTLREEFPAIRSRLPTLWTNNYFVATIGSVSQAIVEQYLADQRNA